MAEVDYQPPRMRDVNFPKEKTVDEKELAAYFDERYKDSYRKSSFRGAEFAEPDVAPPALQPSANDPKLWLVKCKVCII